MTNNDYSQYTQRASADESYRIKDGAGGKGMFIDAIADVPKFQPSLGHKLFDIIMYPAGANHPSVVAGKIPVGTMVHMTWVFVHKGIGPNRDWFICLARTYGQRCPVCEERNRIKAMPGMTDEEVKNAIAPYYSGKYPIGIYNCVHHLNPNHITWQEPVMYWAINNSFMESKLQSMSKSPIGGGFVNYQWPTAGEQGGRHISYECIQKGQYYDYIGHQFVVRQAPIPLHIMQQAVCLDDYLDVPTYDDVKDALMAGMGDPIGGEPTGEGYGGAPDDFPPPWGDEHQAQTQAQSQTQTCVGGGAGPMFGTPKLVCPFSAHGGVLGQTLDSWEECQVCSLRTECEREANVTVIIEPPKPAAPTPTPRPAAPTPSPAVGQSPPTPGPRPLTTLPRRPVK